MWKRLLRRLSRAGEKPPPEPGYVYLLQAGPFYTLGASLDTDEAISELSRRLPFPIMLMHEVYTTDMQRSLAFWQKRFARKRHREEWLALDADDIESFRDESWTM